MIPSRLRVIDLSDELSFYAARLFVGLGADVIRVEHPGGPRLTRSEQLHWHSGKRVARPASLEDGDALVARLLPGADVVLESGAARTLRTPALRDAAPDAWRHVAHVLVTPFGRTGPARDWLADDTVVTASGGMAWLGGTPGEAPEPPPRQQGLQLAGAHAAIGAYLAVIARDRTGQGQLVEISAQESVAATLETGAIAWIHGRTVPGRTSGVYGHVAHRVFAAADGYLGGGYSGSPRMWDDLLAWMAEVGEAEDLTDGKWADAEYRWRGRPHVDEVVGRFVVRRTAAAVAAEARRRALPWAEVAPPWRLADNPQLSYRKFLVEIEAEEGTVIDTGFPYESPALPRPIRLAQPLGAGDDVQWADRASGSAAGTRRKPSRPRGGALDGVRVLDLTWVLAGPYVTKILGEHGAEITKVESSHRKDPTRFAPGMLLRPDASFDDSGYFLNFNRNKRSVALNLRTPRGQELLRSLVPHVDILVENFSPGVLGRWDMAFDQLQALNPRIILVSMAGVGQDGPWRSAVTFADTLAAMSGLTYETGGRGRAPQGLTFGLGDMVAANGAVLGALELLHDGRGGHVDLSQLEAMAASLGPALLEHQLGDTRPPDPLPTIVPTRGEDRWIAVGGAGRELLATALRELTGSDAEPAQVLVSLAADSDADELAAQLQARGIPAYPVRDGRDLVEADRQLGARSFYRDLVHPLAGTTTHEGLVEHLADTPGGLWEPAPLLGQHTDAILTELLGISADALTRLHEEGILE